MTPKDELPLLAAQIRTNMANSCHVSVLWSYNFVAGNHSGWTFFLNIYEVSHSDIFRWWLWVDWDVEKQRKRFIHMWVDDQLGHPFTCMASKKKLKEGKWKERFSVCGCVFVCACGRCRHVCLWYVYPSNTRLVIIKAHSQCGTG